MVASSIWAVTAASTLVSRSFIQTASQIKGFKRVASEYNATVGNTTGCDSAPQPVSAASALWALIALAINAMTQRSGADRFPSADALSPARSSPFVCLADVVVVALWLVHGMRQGLGVRGSMYWYRREMSLLREESDRQLIQGIPAITIFFFILGPLPQAIKALGAEGLYWTKAWAALLLGPWCVEVVVRFSSGLYKPTNMDIDDAGLRSQASFLRKVSLMIHQVAFVTQYCIWLWTIIILSQSEKFRMILAVPIGPFLFILFFNVMIFIGALPFMFLDVGFSRFGIYYLIPSIVFEGLLITMPIWAMPRIKSWCQSASEPLAFVSGIVLFSGVIYVFSWVCTALLIYFDNTLVQLGRNSHNGAPPDFALPSFEAETRPDDDPHASKLWQFAERCSSILATSATRFPFQPRDTREDQIRRALSIAFAVKNLLFATLYYCIKYDSTGTVKPSWTELLG